MKHLCLIALASLIGGSAFAGDAYGSCYIQNGTAHAMYCSQSSSSGSGTGYVTTYDSSGSQLDRSMMIYVGVAVMGCDDVGTVSASSNAVSCSFDF